jgi:prepilin-type N-terminal cleavage/methylation domain-containing protein
VRQVILQAHGEIMMLLIPAKQKAFSMIEVLITLVLIGVGYVSLTLLHTQISKESGLTFRQTESADNAWEQMDSIRNFSALSTYETYATGSQIISSENITGSDGTVYAVKKSVISANSNPSYVFVEGSSTWTDANGDTHTEKFRTAIPEVNPAATVYTWG